MEIIKIKILIENLKKLKNYVSDEKIIFMYEDKILKLNNPELSYYFISNFKKNDTKEQVLEIIEDDYNKIKEKIEIMNNINNVLALELNL